MTKYSQQLVDDIANWVADNGLQEYGGATLKELCQHFAINRKTFHNWEENSLFSAHIKNAREKFKAKVQREIEISIAKSAIGFTAIDEVTKLRPDASGTPTIAEIVRTKKYIPPNVAAGIFLLTNLDSERWQNTQRNDISVKDAPEKMTREQILAELDRLRAKRTAKKEKDGGGRGCAPTA